MEENNVVTVETPSLPSPVQVLVFGIISLALCESVVLGLIFGFLARSKGKQWVQTGNPLPTQVKIGRILALIGIICSFVMIAYWIVAIVGMVTASSLVSY